MVEIDFETEGNVIPWELVVEVFNKLEYGSINSVMFKMLLYTGCRISELSNMKLSCIFSNYLYWKTGKNQTGFRKEKLPLDYIEELRFYLKQNTTLKDQLFNKRGQSLVDYFNKILRPKLSSKWQSKRIHPVKDKFHLEYVYQIKCLRKNFQTLKFHKYFEQYQDYSVALGFISKEMKHKNKDVTQYHYIDNTNTLNLKKYRNLEISEIIKQNNQTSIIDFFKRDTCLIA
jgi:integrase